jgi:hypothetical protein
MVGLNSTLWRFLENYVYYIPSPPPRVRTKPLEVICVGPPRSATESLQHALLQLGYDHTYHGWDLIFEEPHRMPGWHRLARRKFFGDPDGDCHISAQEFDELLGHSVAVTDAASSVFAAEMIEAYPNAKIILNTRKDLDKWHASAIKNIVAGEQNFLIWAMTWFSKDLWWTRNLFSTLWGGLFRSPDGSVYTGITVNGKWIYRGKP